MGSTSFKNKVVGIFLDSISANHALTDLNSNGFDKDDISILAKDRNEIEEKIQQTPDSLEKKIFDTPILGKHIADRAEEISTGHDASDKDPKAMLKGATTGGIIGLIAGLSALLIPGIGTVLVAGPLVAAITSAAAGAALGATAGTLIGIFNDEGIPADRADFYNNNFNKGNIIVMIHTDEFNAIKAKEILIKYKTETIDTF
jgi:hypothetical protein